MEASAQTEKLNKKRQSTLDYKGFAIVLGRSAALAVFNGALGALAGHYAISYLGRNRSAEVLPIKRAI